MQTNDSKLTADFCRRNYVVFRPTSAGEVQYIQERLAEFGIRWCDNAAVGTRIEECISNGMVVQEGKLYHSPGSDTRNVLCKAEQFDKDYLSPDSAFIIEQFNKLAARIDTLVIRIEALEKKVDAVHTAAFPELAATKPGLTRRPGGAP